ncbi:hypothetical protein ACHAXT_000416 [Thalassiosira profunda]
MNKRHHDDGSLGSKVYAGCLYSVLAVYSFVFLFGRWLLPPDGQWCPYANAGQQHRYSNPDYNDDPCHRHRTPYLLYLHLQELEFAQRMIFSLLLGGIIGFERRASERPAGIRTMGLVCLGSCFFSMTGQLAFKSSTMGWDAARVAAAVPSGVGFLGAGLIWKGSTNTVQNIDGELVKTSAQEVHGLTTAASVWLSAAVGVAVGGGRRLYIVSVYGVAMVILILRFGPQLLFAKDSESQIDFDDEVDSAFDWESITSDLSHLDDDDEEDAPENGVNDDNEALLKYPPLRVALPARPLPHPGVAAAAAIMAAAEPYLGWVFRLNLPSVGSVGATTKNASSGADADYGDISEEGVQLLPKGKSAGDYGSSPSSRYLAELCPHHVSVASAPGDDKPSAADTSATQGDRQWSWTYASHSSPSQWNVTSSKLLSVTYRPAHEAYPSHTNISKKREYWHKSVGSCLTCTYGSSCGRCAKCVGGGGGKSPAHKRLKRGITGAPKPIHRVTVNYTVEDIVRMEPVTASPAITESDESGVWIRGVGNCHALRIYLRPKFGTLSTNNDIVDTGKSKNQDDDGYELPQQEEWDSLPSPPWSDGKGEEMDADQKNATRWGAILTFAIPCQTDGGSQNDKAIHKCPPLLWKVDHPPNPHVALDSFLVMDGALHVQNTRSTSSTSSYDYDAPTNVYINGYQSWSFSGSVVQGEPQPKSAMPNVFSAAFNRGAMVMTGDTVCGDNGVGDHWNENMNTQSHGDGGDEAGEDELTEETAFYKSDMYACISSNGATSSYDEERILLDEEDHNDARPMEKGLTTGWCSWYHYYDDIDHDSLSKNAHILEKSMSSIGFNVCLIDDGYMTAWGDWTSLKPGKFVKDGGMRVLADAIRSKGMSPGVWLAPFACDKSSDLAKAHPDWIIRNDNGRYANSANCGKFFYGLDATNPAVRKHVYDTIKRAVDEWGFEVLKLDFLYASCLEGNGKYDPTMSRAEAMYLGLRTIRAAAGSDTFIIGCGCPIGSAVGFVDGMRVSCDTGPTFVPEFPLPHWDNGTLPALRGMLRNTMSRAPLGHRWWHNDPDCILLGDSTKLTDDEVVSAASIVAMTGGMFLLSDDMEKVSEARLSVAKRIFPLTGDTAVPLDLHSTINGGMPSILRLWCSEKTQSGSSAPPNEIDIIGSKSRATTNPGRILQEQASKIECEVGYSPPNSVDPYSRERSCISVSKGLGSWTVVSLSNWLEHPAKLSVSFSALVSHSIEDFVATGAPRSARSLTASASPGEMGDHGFHVFSFWASEYVWIPHQTLVDNSPLIKKLSPHETEIFHIKPANPTRPQYIGSDLHFSCGFEVVSFDWSARHVEVRLKNDYKKKGSIYVYIPKSEGLHKAAVTVNGDPGELEVVAKPSIGKAGEGRVLRVPIEIKGTKGDGDGMVSISW